MADLEIRRVTKQRKRRLLLDGICLKAGAGEVWGVSGPNGAGKSTLLRVMVALTRATGTVTFDGKTYRELPTPRATVGVSFGSLPPSPRESLKTLFLRVARGAGLGPSDVGRAIEQFGLAAAWSEPLERVSEGVRQRGSLALADLGAPRFLLLDEPTRALDPEWLDRFNLWIRSRRSEEATILLTSHDLSSLGALATHYASMANGQLHVGGAP